MQRTTATDLVVVGAGTAGLPAAIEAAAHGLKVTVIEKADRVGGTLWRSWAQLSAGGTSLQRAKGIRDSPDLHFDDVMRISRNTADPELVRLAVDHAPATVEWLLAQGFDMHPDAPAVLHFHEPYLLPRTYWGRNAGRSVLEVLVPAFEKACGGSVTLELGAELTAFRTAERGRVAGVTIRDADGAFRDVDAAAVILTSGGYAGNPELFPRLTSGAPLAGPASPGAEGSGILAAVAAGGRVRGQERFLPTYGGVLRPGSTWETVGLDDYPALTPQSRAPWEIHVNARGERFVAEDAPSVDDRENALLAQPELKFWVVYDAAIRRSAPALFPTWDDADLDRAFQGGHPSFAVAGDLATLAQAAGIDPGGLAATVAAYNAAVASGRDAFGRACLPAPIAEPPFYAVLNHGTTLKSPAGLAVDGRLRVLGPDGPFENLWAAGEVIGGSTLSGKSFVSGMSVTPALGFGRMLGRRAAGASTEPGSM